MPSQRSHSFNTILSIVSFFSVTPHRGHFAESSAADTSAETASAPQCPQNLLPKNIKPKQFGHATVFSRVRQNSHCVLSLATPAPQFGQFRVSTFIQSVLCGGRHFVDRRTLPCPYFKLLSRLRHQHFE